MTRATVLRASNYRRMPWKNGGGETVEVAVSPEGAALSDFDWRVSMATVATDGPFSIFPGIDRTLSIIDGNGMQLAIGGDNPLLLTQDSAPLAFAADVAVTATLAEGPITDLNVMTRRDGLRHRVERVDIDSRATFQPAAPTWLLLCHRGALTVEWSGQSVDLGQGDTLLLEQAGAVELLLEQPGDVEVSGRARCFLILIDPV